MNTDQAVTRRQFLTGVLRKRPSARPTALSKALYDNGFELTPAQVVTEISELKHSLNDDEMLYVAPAECRDCGFTDWNTLLNIPSKCPDCRSQWIEEPEFTIEQDTE